MISPGHLAESYARNIQIIKLQTDGLSQQASLIQLPFRANCMNWIVGHLVTNRNNVLKLLGIENPPYTSQVARYTRESEPVTEHSKGVLPLENLLEMLESTQEQIAGLLAKITPEALDRQVAYFAGRSMSVGEWLLFFYFHDSYHTGQSEILRQASGKDDKII